jgi:hypothetical protein
VSADLGEFGPADGKGVTYNFKRIYHAQGLIPWLVFGLAFLALKENRTARATLLLIPIVLLGVLCSSAEKMVGMDSGGAVQINFMFTVLVVGFSMVWLLAERIGNRNRFVTFLLAALIYLGFLGVSLLGGGFGDDTTMMAVFAGISIVAVLGAFFLARIAAGEVFNRRRFLIWLPIALYSLLLISFAIVMGVSPRIDNYPLSSMVVEVLVASFFTGVVYCISLVPFVVLLLSSPFWRKRFYTILGIRD